MKNKNGIKGEINDGDLFKQIDIKKFFSERVKGFKTNGNGQATGHCPFHDDTNPSFSVNIIDGLWICHACDAKGNFYQFEMKLSSVDFKTAVNNVEKWHNTSSANSQPKPVIKATYDYTDENGNSLFQTVRYEPKAFKQRRSNGKGGWIWNRKGVKSVLYHLPQIKAADTVYIVEGEKDSETLSGLGLTATTSPMGAGNWKPDYNCYLKDKNIVCLPDNDSKGKNHMEEVAGQLKGVAKSVKVVLLPNLPEKGDVTDWLGKGGTKEALVELVQLTPEWEPSEEQQGEETKVEKSKFKILMKIGENLSLFHDQYRIPHGFLDGNTVPLTDIDFGCWLSHQFYKKTGLGLGSETLKQAINTLSGIAIFDGKEYVLENRVASDKGCCWYDMGDDRAIKITGTGWKIVKAPILFKRYMHQRIQVDPIPNGNVNRLFELVKINKNDQLLFIVYVITCYIADFPHPVMHLTGAQGASKSTVCCILKKLIDPSKVELPEIPRDKQELIQTLSHHHVSYFDNLSEISDWLSDLLCRAVTGLSAAKRTLYTNDQDFILSFKRCVGLSGITGLINKPDLLDRAIPFYLEPITEEERMEESVLWEKFEQIRPEILGGIFDLISKAIQIHATIKTSKLPRMADFAKWGFAIAEALGVNGEVFLKQYRAKIETQNNEVLEGHLLAKAVTNFMADKTDWIGTVKGALEELKKLVVIEKGDETFPKAYRSLRPYLETIRTNLMAVGITYKISDKPTSEGYRICFKKNFFGSEIDSSKKALETNSNQANELNELNSSISIGAAKSCEQLAREEIVLQTMVDEKRAVCFWYIENMVKSKGIDTELLKTILNQLLLEKRILSRDNLLIQYNNCSRLVYGPFYEYNKTFSPKPVIPSPSPVTPPLDPNSTIKF